MAYNRKQVTETLQTILQILRAHNVEYRVLGSLIPAAMQGSLHRKIGDVDAIIDIREKEIVIKELETLGYYKTKRNPWRASELLGLYIFEHPELLEMSFFIGNFGGEKLVIPAGPMTVTVNSEAIKPTKYTLYGIEFIGIPQNTAYAGALVAKSNPKRKKELEIFEKRGIKPRSQNYLNLYLHGLRVNWLIDFINGCLYLIGTIRVKLGFPYDPWR